MRWVTTERVQVDRLASAWLIRRFVDIDAEFAFVPRGTQAADVSDGTPFYLPGAALGKRDGHTTFEAILETYQIADPALQELGQIIRAADELHGPVAFRGVPVRQALPVDAPPETAGLQLLLYGVRLLNATDELAVDAAMWILDIFYAGFKGRREGASAR